MLCEESGENRQILSSSSASTTADKEDESGVAPKAVSSSMHSLSSPTRRSEGLSSDEEAKLSVGLMYIHIDKNLYVVCVCVCVCILELKSLYVHPLECVRFFFQELGCFLFVY